jgi:hypothetical protein
VPPPERYGGDAGDRQSDPIAVRDIDTAPVSVPVPVQESGVSYEVLLNRFTKVSEENFELKAKLERMQSRVRTAETLDSLIQPYAFKAYVFMVCYALAAGGILIADGLTFHGFDLPDSVLELLVGSTAVTVIGLVGMVLTGIFVGARKAG